MMIDHLFQIQRQNEVKIFPLQSLQSEDYFIDSTRRCREQDIVTFQTCLFFFCRSHKRSYYDQKTAYFINDKKKKKWIIKDFRENERGVALFPPVEIIQKQLILLLHQTNIPQKNVNRFIRPYNNECTLRYSFPRVIFHDEASASDDCGTCQKISR